jgi:hypothetical protein
MAPKTPRLGIYQAAGITAMASSAMGVLPAVAGVAGVAAQSTPAIVGAQLAAKARATSAIAAAVRPTTDLIKGVARATGAGGIANLLNNKTTQNQLIQLYTKAATIDQQTKAQTDEIVNRVKQGVK